MSTDNYPTATSQLQLDTEALLVKGDASAVLDTNGHLGYLGKHMLQGLPARYVSQDASQGWLLFWSLQSLSLLKVELDEGNKKRAAATLLAMQDIDGGGFGGGPGQRGHLLPTYAAVCALAIVGDPESWAQIDRKRMYEWFMDLKEPDGSFRVSRNGEVDGRGVYCLLAVARLLGITTEELVKGTAEFVAGCQTYEGGFGAAAWAGVPLGEAHGGYTFCALASWVLLEPTQPKINTRALRRWLVNMQGGESELYGFRGRTNKLVDGCYSWWVGGCFALLDKLEGAEQDIIWNAEGLKDYILYAAQHPAGGLRDKPPKSSDLYHTLYCLAGLSAAQSASTGHQSLNITDPLFNLTATHSERIMAYYSQNDTKS